MPQKNTTSRERILTTLAHQEPDRVPFFLPVSLHGARELGISLREYFSSEKNIVEAQLRLRAKYRHDCVTTYFYAALENEAWGGDVTYFEDGPPNAGMPVINKPEDIKRLTSPKVNNTACLKKVLAATEMLKEKVADAPLVGVVLSPFSLPVMQMGFDKYIELMYEQPELFWHLMGLNEEFCVAWANAQLAAGADMIVYFDPVSSSTITQKELYLKTGCLVAKRTLSQIKGPVAMHMASGRCLPVLNEMVNSGAKIVVTSVLEDLAEIKAVCKKKATVMGNLNTIAMHRWTPQQAESAVKDAIFKAGAGGGYILSDNQSEIPVQTPEEVLLAISEAVLKWGRYPLDWVKDYGR